MRRNRGIVWLAVSVAACAGGPGPEAAPTPDPAPSPTAAAPTTSAARAAEDGSLVEAAATITPADALAHVSFLASDELRGRDTPSPGLERAAEYIANEFRSFGLEPAGDSGTFIQRWPYTNVQFVARDLRVSARGPQGTESAQYRSEFFLMSGPMDSVSASITFAGTAMPGRSPIGAQGRGRVVAMYMPGASPEGQWPTNLTAAIGAAMPAGPAAVLLILDPAFEEIGAIAGELTALTAPLPVIGLDYEAAARMFAVAGQDIDALRQNTGATGATSIDDLTLTVVSRRTSEQAEPPNVVGMLRGSHPQLRDTYVVFSAHIDHVGVGVPDASGDSIYNGADDDASGTSALLEVAQAFASLPTPPARSLIFLGVSGEEKGLFGSQYFTQNPTVPSDAMVADINIDMIGRNAPDSVVAIGMDYTSIGRLVQEVARAHPELGLTVAPDLWPEENLFTRSDHFNFARIGVPPIFFTTGLHEDYHERSDEADKIDEDKLARIARLVFYLGNEIATRPDPPTWTPEGRRVVQNAGG